MRSGVLDSRTHFVVRRDRLKPAGSLASCRTELQVLKKNMLKFSILVALVCSLAQGQTAAGEAAAPARERTVWDGVYTEAQAARGEEAFSGMCSSCHRAGFQGPGFMQRWREDKVAAFYNFMSTKMPINAPGIATKQQYLDIVAYVLSTNKFPAGSQELAVEDLGKIQVVGKEGPQPVPDGALVWSVGCLTQGDDWESLTRASEPIRTREAETPPEAEMKAAGQKALGSLSFRFLYIESLKPTNLKGQKIMARGFLDREPKGDRLLATGLIPLGGACQ